MMTKLVIICAALVREHAHARWRLLSERYPVDVTLLVPQRWEESTVWNTRQRWQPKEIHDGQFHVLPLPILNFHGCWVFASLGMVLRRLKPDVIHVIQGEMAWPLTQAILWRDLWWRKAKITFFTMNALGAELSKLRHKLRWTHIQHGVEAGLCHYPGCLSSLRGEGFKKPVFLQTQVGVDDRVFRPDDDLRHRCRTELGIDDRSFVIGCVIRLTEEKGILDLLAALPIPGISWTLLLVGEGKLRGKVMDVIRARGIADRVVMTGLVPPNDVARYLTAMDCLVHVPHSTSRWIETFSLAVAQGMTCGLPVIGSDTGSVPWQVQNAGIIVSEHDPEAIHRAILSIASDPEKRRRLGTIAREQALTRFCIGSLTDGFYSILQQVLSGDYTPTGGCDSQDCAHLYADREWEGMAEQTRR